MAKNINSTCNEYIYHNVQNPNHQSKNPNYYTNMSHSHIIILVATLLFVSSLATTIAAANQIGDRSDRKMLVLPPPGSKYAFRVNNALGAGVWINVHCKTKHHDLGNRLLPPNKSFDVAFNINYFRSTLFFCHVTWHWPGNDQSHYFEAYDYDRDHDWCKLGQVCCWNIKPSGPCDCNDDKKCIAWDKPYM